MLDTSALQKLVEQQVKQEVAERVAAALNDQRIKSIEDNAIKFIQDRIVAKFANSEAMPELVEAVKGSVRELFHSGQIPGLGQYVDYDFITQSVNNSTQELIKTAIQELSVDKNWLEKIETLVNQQMTSRVVAKLSSTDINSLVNQRVDEITDSVVRKIIPGIQDQSSAVELTLLDENVVVENTLTAKNITAVESVTVKNLTVKGSINTDNHAWQALADDISKKTLDNLSVQWKQTLIQQVADEIKQRGIEFESVTVNGEQIVTNNQLSGKITQSNLQTVGTLENLKVTGEVSLHNTVNVLNRRLGVNTAQPDMAVSIWDEEVAISVGKHKENTAYFGTTRKQGLTIGTNKTPMIEIDEDGLTSIKKLQVGIHKIGHGNEVPNYSGTRGDIVFNAVPTIDNPVFGWQCLGGYRWKVIKAVQ